MTDIIDGIIEYVTDYENPLVSYGYLIAIALTLRLFWIVIPLWRIQKKYYVKGMLKRMLHLKKVTGLKGIEAFLIWEIITMVLPALVAIFYRYVILGNVPVIEWTIPAIILGFVVGVMWLSVDIIRTRKTRKSLLSVLNWYSEADSEKVNGILENIIWTRERLDKVSNWEIETKKHDEVVDIEPDESTISKVGKFLSSAFESVKITVKHTLKDAAEMGVQKIDSTLQKKVDDIVKESPPRRWKSLLVDLANSLWPLLIISIVLPLLS